MFVPPALSLWERASLPLLPQRERPAKRGSASRVRAARFGRLAAESALTQPSPTAVGEGNWASARDVSLLG